MSITADLRQPDPKKIKSKLAIRWVIWGIRFIAGLVIWVGDMGNALCKTAKPPNPHRRAKCTESKQSQWRVGFAVWPGWGFAV